MRVSLLLACALVGLAGCQKPVSSPVSTAVAAPPAGAVYAAGSFPLDVKEVDATLDAIQGKDTAAATMSGRVQRADAEEYCERDPDGATTAHGGAGTKAQCVADTLKQEVGKRYAASADCSAKTIVSTIGPFSRAPTGWKGSDGQVLDGSNASGAPTVDAEFATLCPAAAKALSIGGAS